MKGKFSHIGIWLLIVLIAGWFGSYLFNISFLVSGGIAAAALIVNGLIASWEDKDM